MSLTLDFWQDEEEMFYALLAKRKNFLPSLDDSCKSMSFCQNPFVVISFFFFQIKV